MTALSVLIIGLALLQQPVKETVGWVPQRIEDLKYPRLANYALVQGTVRVEIAFTETGAVRGTKAIQGHPLLANAALENVKRWTFRKNERSNSSPDANSTILTYVFKLEGLTPEAPIQSFVFEYPGTVTITSEAMCASHVPCRRDPSYRPTPSKTEQPNQAAAADR